jgi:hypothetical protein
MTKTWLLATVSACGLLVGAADARADIVAATAQIHGGYADGRGIGGAQEDEAFFEGAAGPSYGVRAGVEILFATAWLEHNQFLGEGGVHGTWTQVMAGLSQEFGVGSTRKGMGAGAGGAPAAGASTASAPTGGYSAYFAEAGLAVGFGVGTGQQVEPPLSNSQITDKGVVGQVTLGGGYRISEMLSVGVQVPVQGAYLFKSGDGLFANDDATHYYAIHASALLNLRLRLGF